MTAALVAGFVDGLPPMPESAVRLTAPARRDLASDLACGAWDARRMGDLHGSLAALVAPRADGPCHICGAPRALAVLRYVADHDDFEPCRACIRCTRRLS